ncbi:MAG: hypothetical protein KAS23_05600 [Anaerohalosphaera sp.]|nr:hypothetical protein [Anaerohalosphaera sp.]
MLQTIGCAGVLWLDCVFDVLGHIEHVKRKWDTQNFNLEALSMQTNAADG